MPTLKLIPKSCSDNFYSLGNETPQTMAALQNLVPAPDTADQWIPRPAATLFSGSAPFTPGFVSCQIIVGTRLYGMVSSALNAGKDQPFCYDLLGAAFVTITGITGANTPTSPATTGSWQPPHMELIGTKIIVTHPGFDGVGSNFFGVINTTNPVALTWTSENTTGLALPIKPVWVSQFFQRAYYFCNTSPSDANPAVIASNVLDPTVVTAAPDTPVLQFGDNIPLLCGGTLALDNQLGGQIQALIVFKANASNMFQITGDFAATSTNGIPFIQMNALNVATGTLAPNSITNTPFGMLFVSPDGLRIIDFQAHVSEPIGANGQGISIPFISAVTPSRIAAACNATTVRIGTQNGSLSGTPYQEWDFDLVRKTWFGPHTFPISLISTYGQSYVISPVGIKGLWSSDIRPNSSSTYTENGASYTCIYQSALFPERSDMEELSTVRSVFYTATGPGTTVYNVSALDEGSNIITYTSVSFTSSTTLWGSFAWGVGVWLGTNQPMSAAQVPWTQPVVFDRMAVQISFTAASGARLGNFLIDVEPTNYTVTS